MFPPRLISVMSLSVRSLCSEFIAPSHLMKEKVNLDVVCVAVVRTLVVLQDFGLKHTEAELQRPNY